MDTQPREYYKIDLIGDSCTDVYHYGRCERLSPEAPVPVLKENKRVALPGMSWNVRLNIESFGAMVMHYTNDEKIYKHRFIDSRYNQHLLRWDEGEHQPIKQLNPNIIRSVEVPDAVVLSDYKKGWLHFDCAATYRKSATDKWAAGATGVGVRSIAGLLLQQANK